MQSVSRLSKPFPHLLLSRFWLATAVLTVPVAAIVAITHCTRSAGLLKKTCPGPDSALGPLLPSHQSPAISLISCGRRCGMAVRLFVCVFDLWSLRAKGWCAPHFFYCFVFIFVEVLGNGHLASHLSHRLWVRRGTAGARGNYTAGRFPEVA